jgi:hypothetical protein
MATNMATCSAYGFYLAEIDGDWLMVRAGDGRWVLDDDHPAEGDERCGRTRFSELLMSIIDKSWVF